MICVALSLQVALCLTQKLAYYWGNEVSIRGSLIYYENKKFENLIIHIR